MQGTDDQQQENQQNKGVVYANTDPDEETEL